MVLYCIVFHCFCVELLCWIILLCVVWYCIVCALFCVVVGRAELYSMMAFCLALYSVWYWIGLDLIVLHCLVLSCSFTYLVVWCCIVLYSIALCCTLLCCLVLLCGVWYCLVLPVSVLWRIVLSWFLCCGEVC